MAQPSPRFDLYLSSCYWIFFIALNSAMCSKIWYNCKRNPFLEDSSTIFTDVLVVKFYSLLSWYIIRRKKNELKVYSLNVFLLSHFSYDNPFLLRDTPLLANLIIKGYIEKKGGYDESDITALIRKLAHSFRAYWRNVFVKQRCHSC